MPSSTTAAPGVAPLSPSPTVASLRELFDRQHARRARVAASTPRERADKLRRLGAVIRAHRGEIAEAMRVDFGKHPDESELTDIQLILAELNYAISHLGGWMKPKRVRTPVWVGLGSSEVRYEPQGVVLILGAWNFPFALLIGPLVPAIAAGNCVILRPSEKVPHTNAVLAKIVAEAFEPDEIALVEGGVSTAEALLELPFDHIFFTGSVGVGKRIMAAASKTLASCTLELGGKSPAIVDVSADVDVAAERLVWGKFTGAGQACVAPDYVFVHRSRRADLVSAMQRTLVRFYGETEDDRARSADFSRVVDASSVARLARLVEDAARRGATVVTGGRWDAATRYVAPTILTDVPHDAAVMEDEIFGPVLPVLDYDDLDEVFHFIRTRGKPLALYMFSRDKAAVSRVLANTTAGGTTVNNALVHLANPNLPFGGVGSSGFGSYHGLAGFKAFSHERSVFVQKMSGASMYYPPYGPRTRRLVEWMARLRG